MNLHFEIRVDDQFIPKLPPTEIGECGDFRDPMRCPVNLAIEQATGFTTLTGPCHFSILMRSGQFSGGFSLPQEARDIQLAGCRWVRDPQKHPRPEPICFTIEIPKECYMKAKVAERCPRRR
jgi:hypothetical protein